MTTTLAEAGPAAAMPAAPPLDAPVSMTQASVSMPVALSKHSKKTVTVWLVQVCGR